MGAAAVSEDWRGKRSRHKLSVLYHTADSAGFVKMSDTVDMRLETFVKMMMDGRQ